MTSRRARIGYVIGQLTRGGAERQLYELVRSIDTGSFQPFVYCLSEKTVPYGDLVKASGAELRVLYRRRHFDMARVKELATLLRRDRIDIVHSFLFKANSYAWPAHLLAGVPYFVTSARSCNTELDLLQRWVNRLAFKSSDAVVCNGEAVGSFVMRYFSVPREKLVIIHNGIDLTQFQTCSRAFTTTGNDPNCDRVVITVARLVPEKDIELFVEAAKLLSQQYANVRFLIAGDGPCRPDLIRLARESGLDGRICFLGERDDVPQLLLSADVFWLTSKWEGLPNVVLEAMACGRPVIARDVGACRELIRHSENGFLISNRDASTIARHTLHLLTHPEYARTMGLAGRQFVEENFSVYKMSAITEALYLDLLEGRFTAAGRSPRPDQRIAH